MKGGGTPAVLEEKTVALDMAGGDQEVTPSTGYTGLSKAVVTRPATFLAENIKNGVTIGGVQGTFVGTAIANNLDDLVDGEKKDNKDLHLNKIDLQNMFRKSILSKGYGLYDL